MAHIGTKIKERRLRFRWSIQKLATLSGLDASFISRLEREKSGYSPATEEVLAKTLNTTVARLHGAESNVVEASPDHRRIPVIDFIQAGQFALGDLAFEDEEWMRETIMTNLDHSPRSFAMLIHGRSMEPEFRDGDIIVLDPEVKPMPGDFVVAAKKDGEAVFKRYRVTGLTSVGKDVFELVPLNPDYPTWKSIDLPLKVVAVLVEHRRPRRR